MNRIARTIATTAAVVATVAIAAPGQASADSPPRWERAVVTVHVADEAAWAGTDVAGSLTGWSKVLPMALTDDLGADIVLESHATQDAAPTAYPVVEGSRITSCRVVLPPRMAGTDATFVLPHELGHCLGLGHNLPRTGKPSVMYWIAGGEWFAAQPSVGDLKALRGLYR